MAATSPIRVTNPGSISLGPRFYALVAVLTLLLFPAHELAHYLTYRALGVHLRMTLNTASPADQRQRKPAAELAGPVLNLLIAAVAAAAYRRVKHGRQWWAALAVASALMRLVVYVLVIGAAIVTGSGLSLGNDEPIAAHLLGLPSLTLVAVFALPFVIILWDITRTFPGGQLRKVLHVLALGFMTLCVGILVGRVIDPWLFSNR